MEIKQDIIQNTQRRNARLLRLRWSVTVIALVLAILGATLLLTPRPSLAAATPCGSWSHSSWSSGTVTWTKGDGGCWSATISDGTETCVWSDSCAHTTKPDDVHAASYTKFFEGLAKPDPSDHNTWYFEAKFKAVSSCDGADDIVVSTHPYDDCRCGCSCGK